MKRRILVLGAGLYNGPVLTQLKRAGFHVLAIDRDPKAPGAALADEFMPIDISDREAVSAWAAKQGLDGIMPINDYGTRTAAFVAAKLGLPGITEAAADASCDKGRMRDAWAAAKLPVPGYRVVATVGDVTSAAAELGYPCVLKPTDSGGGGRGISVLKVPGDVDWAYAFAAPHARNGRLIVEQFIDGTEMTIEGLSQAGTVTILAMCDKVKPDLRTRVATSLNYPAAFPEEVLQSVRRVVEQAVQALGIVNGMSHTEVIVTSTGPVLVETAARGGGGHIFHTIIEAVSGFCAPVQCAHVLTGTTIAIPPLTTRGAAYRFFNPPRGVLREVRNVESARGLPGVLDIGITKNPGELVGDLKNSLERPGFVVTCGETRGQAVEVADRVERLVEFVLESAS
jgi:biotin carboxylase